MLIYNGTDYTIPVFVMVSAIILFALQSTLCKRCRRLWVKLLPLLYVLLWLVLAVHALLSEPDGFIDLRGLVAMMFAIYALICAVSIGLAWLIGWLKSRK